MATNDAKPSTGTGCDNAWTVTFNGSNPFAQSTNWNRGPGNPCGIQFFQGHDHLFAREELDGVIYQEAPIPSDATYHVGDTNLSAFTGMITNDSGHLRVTVSPTGVKVEYVRAVLPADETPELTNGAVSMVYTLPNMGSMGDGS